MNARRLWPLPLVLAALLAGCASGASDLGRTPVATSDVAVYEGVDEVEGEYEVLTVLPQVERGGYGAGRNVVDQMRAAAGRLGANGLLVVDAETTDARIRTAIAQGSSVGRTQYIAIYVTPAE